MRKRLLIIIVALLFISGIFTAPSNVAKKLRIVATTSFIYDALLNIGGNKIDLHNLLGAGIDPHSYRPTEKDTAFLVGADLIFWNGNYLEAHLSKPLNFMHNSFEIAKFFPDAFFQKWEETETTYNFDPHFWNDPYIWMRVVKKCSEVLAEYDKQNAKTYQKNAKQYIQKIKKAHSYIKTQVAKIPAPKVVITTHDAFSYFGKRYGIKMLAVQGITTDSDPSVSDIQELTDTMAIYGVSVVFGETTVNKDSLKSLREAAKAKGIDNASISNKELYSDALSDENGPAPTYIDYLKYNTDVLVNELTGN